jgi:dihydroxyacetone kinase
MERGARAAVEASQALLERDPGAQTLLVQAGAAWAEHAGGTSGVLWGALLDGVGRGIGDDGDPDGAAVAAGVEQATEAVRKIGGAQPGDKTMVDALVPFTESLSAAVEQGTSLHEAWGRAAAEATTAAEATADLLPKLGRARPHAEKSRGSADPGAVSFALIVTAIGEQLKG